MRNQKGGAFHVDQFVNPQSMITPGIAGTATMVLTNTLCQQFAGLPANWTALGMSFLFGTVVFAATSSLLLRGVYYLINSLFIFVMAHGSNTLGQKADAELAALDHPAIVRQVNGENAFPLVLASFAGGETRSVVNEAAAPGSTSRMQLAQSKDKDKEKKDKEKKDKDKAKSSKFFRDW